MKVYKVRDLMILELLTLYVITATSLIALGEVRLDAYISLYILEYFIVRALNRVEVRLVSRLLTVIDAVLFAVFAYIVAVRVLEILTGV